MKIKGLELKIGDKVTRESWINGKYVTVTDEVKRSGRFVANDETGHESVYGKYGDDWRKIDK